MTVNQPDKIGRYQILERVGRGGMGVLYRGMDPVLDREVAIKVMLVDFSEDAEQMRPRFYREARAAARLQHRNIVTIFEFAEEANSPYIVMEFLRGTTLAPRMSSPVPLTLDEKLNIVIQLCEALDYAHEQGVVHRDVKPANIFLLNDGTVKLLDFGIAKVTSSTLTREGDVLGSASYMSPEQVSGADSVDGRSDIFSAGVVMFELLAGRKPFHAEAPTAIIMKILHEEPPAIEELVPGLPAPLAAAVRRALAKKAADRYPSAGEMVRELQWIRRALQASAESGGSLDETRFASPSEVRAFQEAHEKSRTSVPASASTPGSSTSAPLPAPSTSRPGWIIPAAVAALLAIGVVAVFLMRGGNSPSSDTSVTGAGPSAPAATPAPTPPQPEAPPPPPAVAEYAVRVESTPPEAGITLNGQDTKQVTPATVTITGPGPHTIRLARRGFVSQQVELGEADLEKGALAVTLAAAEVPMVPVAITSTYPVEVLNGSKPTGPAAESHQVRVPAGTVLTVRSSQYLLNAQVKADGKQVNYQAPAIGYLSVLTRFETCRVRIGQADVGFPPISKLPVVSGQHRVDIACSDGQNPQGQMVTVQPNQLATARIF